MRIHQAAADVRESIDEYLTTTFGGVDEHALEGIRQLISPNGDSGGIFRGPYLQFKTPFVRSSGGEGFFSWQPDWFIPHAHQLEAWKRIHEQHAPTIVTTGTGSGKTESFLFPILEHARAARAEGTKGIKAVLIYPMNALAFDQAGRIAELMHDTPELKESGLRVGLYAGESGKTRSMEQHRVIDHRDTLRDSPPDILLTNYKMLDLLVGRAADQSLWTQNAPETLRFVVLDEFHTFDGAQGTDVALLLRRLSDRLGMRTPGGGALGSAIPIATSATLGSGADAKARMSQFASRVFDRAIGEDAFVGEQRQSRSESLLPENTSWQVPSLEQLAEIEHERDLDHATSVFLADALPDAWADALLAHPLLHLLVEHASNEPVSIYQLADFARERFEQWQSPSVSTSVVEAALLQFADLVTQVRRAGDAPLVHVAAHLWARDVRRVNRFVGPTPAFQFELEFDGHAARPDQQFAPAIHCINCRRTGWMFLAAPGSNMQLKNHPRKTRTKHAERSKYVRAVIVATEGENVDRFLDTENLVLTSASGGRGVLGVHISDDEQFAKRSGCPFCEQLDSIQFVGARLATIASVATTALFRDHLDSDVQTKVLAFADSVQDASHRAAFLGARTHRFNLRGALASSIGPQDNGSTLADIASGLVNTSQTADGARQRRRLVPSDLLNERDIETIWSEQPDATLLDRFRTRIELDAQLEFGLTANIGRSLTNTYTVAPWVRLEGEGLAKQLDEVLSAAGVQLELDGNEPDAVMIARGIVDRMLARGGIAHPWLERYREEGGNPFLITAWDQRPRWAPAFPRTQRRPEFPADGNLSSESGLTRIQPTKSGTISWYQDWLQRTAGLGSNAAAKVVTGMLRILRDAGIVDEIDGRARSWGLLPDAIELHGTADDENDNVARLTCPVCTADVAVPELYAQQYDGAPCRSYRCSGVLERAAVPNVAYYRSLYNAGTTRVISAEHTGLLDKEEREDVETRFKRGTDANDPNLVVATPTLEMGVDIGDLSAVLLTGVPPTTSSYIQRAGRSGRKTGNALTVTIAESDPRSLYWFAEPSSMIAGDVTTPDTFLDAFEILKRHLFAWLIDRVARRHADGEDDAPPIPDKLHTLAKDVDGSAWLDAVIDPAQKQPEATADAFLHMLGRASDDPLRERFVSYMLDHLYGIVRERLFQWREFDAERIRHQKRVREAWQKLNEAPSRTPEQDRELRELAGELKATDVRIRTERNITVLQGLDQLGLLPNYALPSEPAHLTATLRGFEPDTKEWTAHTYTVDRPQVQALREFAPGARFYAHGHRFRITGIDMQGSGGKRQLPVETYFLCPDCSWAVADLKAPGRCQRCGSRSINEVSAKFQLSRIESVTCEDGERSSRVSDDSEQRDVTIFATQTTVDVATEDVVTAWESPDSGFAWEVADATVRRLNFGQSGTAGAAPLQVAGYEHDSRGFTLCRHCGVEKDAGRTKFVGFGKPYETVHRRRCPHRDKGDAAVPDEAFQERVALFHEQRSPVVRMLVPITSHRVDERLASIKSAVMRGILDVLGGSLDHIEMTATKAPGGMEGSQRNMLVLIDSIPGGSGYLQGLAEVDQMHAVLLRAKEIVATCECRDATGSPVACHRCLYHPRVPSRDFEHISRDDALDVLTEILDAWDVDKVAALNEVDIQGLEESELEKAFRASLFDLLRDRGHSVSITLDKQSHIIETPSGKQWTLKEQVTLKRGGQVTIPDFVLRCDAEDTTISVYADGFHYHASEAHNRIADDAAKRHELREDGQIVWNVTWEDVEAVRAGLDNGTAISGRDDIGSHDVERETKKALHEMGGEVDDAMFVQANPIELLVKLLDEPDWDRWHRLAKAHAIGVLFGFQSATVGGRSWARVATKEAIAAIASETLTIGFASTAPAQEAATLAVAQQGVHERFAPLYVYDLSRQHETGSMRDARTSVVLALPDNADALRRENFKAAWQQWLHLANVLQFCEEDQASFVMTATSKLVAERSSFTGIPTEASVLTRISQPRGGEWEQRVASFLARPELKWEDEACIEFISRVLHVGPIELPEPGIEVNSIPVAFAWKSQQIAIVPARQQAVAGELPEWRVFTDDAAVEAVRSAVGDEP